MQLAVCHYSLHRTWEERGWNCLDLARTVKELGVDWIDFHARYVGDPADAASEIRAALRETGLQLSGFSLSTNFNQTTSDALEAELTTTRRWLQLAADLGAPVVRIFGGHGVPRTNATGLEQVRQRVQQGLETIVPDAERLGLVLALENHGCMPCTGEEQAGMIAAIDSPHLRATIDIGNYLLGGQEGHDGTRAAAPHAAYVHIKDYNKVPDPDLPWGYKATKSGIGEGDVDIPACLSVLQKAGYNGIAAIEYEGSGDELVGVTNAVAYAKGLLAAPA